MKPELNYTVYLVTDSTPAVLGDASLAYVVEEAILGGVTLVQYRDKTASTRVAVATARELLAICRPHHVGLIVNDRVDVAREVDCEGVHLGQDDLGTRSFHTTMSL